MLLKFGNSAIRMASISEEKYKERGRRMGGRKDDGKGEGMAIHLMFNSASFALE